MFTDHKRAALTVIGALSGCGNAEMFSLEGFSNTVPIESASTASLHLDGHDVTEVRVLGDIDGDGVDDALVMTSEFDDVNGNWGMVHVLYGGTATGDVDVASLPVLASDPDSPPLGDLSQFQPLGDIDGDGLADFAVMKTSGTMCDGYHDSHARDGQHKGAYIIYGNATRLDGVVALADIGVTIEDPALCTGNWLGVFRLGDIDGDGLDDFGAIDPPAVGFPTDVKTYVFYGRRDRFTGVVDVTTAVAALVQVGNEMPLGILSLGDVDGDGRADFAVQTTDFEPTNSIWTNGARIIYSSDTRFAGSLPLDQPRSTVIPSADCAPAISRLDDLDGDGLADLSVIQCVWDDSQGQDPPPATHHIFYGRTGGFAATLDLATADATITTAPGGIASALASGDVDGDGIRDLVMSDPTVRDDAGAVYVMPGTGSRLAGEVALGGTATAYVGHEVRVGCFNENEVGCTGGQYVGAMFGLGDLTGDGLVDVLASAPTVSFPGEGMGARAYVVSPASIR